MQSLEQRKKNVCNNWNGNEVSIIQISTSRDTYFYEQIVYAIEIQSER